jgi:hypothetical protein
MSQGRVDLQLLQHTLSEFEQAIMHREHKRLLDSKTVLQQDVDQVRQKVVDLVVQLVTAERLKSESAKV